MRLLSDRLAPQLAYHVMMVQGHNILIVDEVDDTRKTLSYAVEELHKDIEQERTAYKAACTTSGDDGMSAWKQPTVGIFVVHNKLKPKQAQLPAQLMAQHYFVGEDIPDHWVMYPWDATDIGAHTLKAEGREPLHERNHTCSNDGACQTKC